MTGTPWLVPVPSKINSRSDWKGMGIHLEDGWRRRFFRGIAVLLREAAVFLSVPDWLFPDSIHPEDQVSPPHNVLKRIDRDKRR